MRKIFRELAVSGLVVGLLIGATQGVQAAGPNTVVGGTNPWVFNLTSTTADGVDIRGVKNGTGQLFQVFDFNGAPIFSIPPAGGPAVLGDNFRVNGSDIFNADVTVWGNGSITIGQRAGGPTFYGGAADPNVTPPDNRASFDVPPTIHPFHNGDRYFRANGNTYVYTNGTWVIK